MHLPTLLTLLTTTTTLLAAPLNTTTTTDLSLSTSSESNPISPWTKHRITLKRYGQRNDPCTKKNDFGHKGGAKNTLDPGKCKIFSKQGELLHWFTWEMPKNAEKEGVHCYVRVWMGEGCTGDGIYDYWDAEDPLVKGGECTAEVGNWPGATSVMPICEYNE